MLLDADGRHEFVNKSGGPIDWPWQDGALVSKKADRQADGPNHVVSLLHFRDADLHVEFMLPATGSGNSGIYIHGHYELQILNSYGEAHPNKEDMGAVYGFAPPLVNAARPPGQWQVYDIRYRAPRANLRGRIKQKGTITAWLNGRKVQLRAEFGMPRSVYHPYRYGTTSYLEEIAERQKRSMTGPVFLQDHQNPVRFRNIWVRPLDDFAYFYDPCDPE